MSERKIGFDNATLDGKIKEDNDKYLVAPAIIASEIVQQYEDGWAYKPADELERMAETASDLLSRPIKILEHPGADTNYLLIKKSDMNGRAENFQFVKNLNDPKTNRPMRRGVLADIRWFKNRTPSSVLDQIRNGSLRDVSIGFTFDVDQVSGEWNGVKYDYVQRNIFLDHVAAPIPAGRCPGPICGIGYDSASTIRFDAAILTDCPVCRRIKDVGFSLAGKRLYEAFGPDVLEVIETGYKPKPIAPPKGSIDDEYRAAFDTLKKNLLLTP
jgi:hypothetical protein